MDPLTITASCVSLTVAITKSSLAVTKFIRDFRTARRDLDAVSRELLSLKTVLDLLADDASNPEVAAFPPTLSKQITGIVCNCTDVVQEIERVLERHDGGTKATQAARWVTIGHEDMAKLRSNLEAHKSALEIALEMVALTLARETNTNTIEILHDTSAIKEDTAQILAEISRLQRQLPRGSNRRSATEFMLERYLGNLSTYAETVCESWSDGTIPTLSKVDEDEWAVLSDSDGRHGEGVKPKSVLMKSGSIGTDGKEKEPPVIKRFASTQSMTPISDDWWEDEEEIPIIEAESFVISPRKATSRQMSPFKEDKKGQPSMTSTNTPASPLQPRLSILVKQISQTRLENGIIPDTGKKSRQSSNSSNTVRFTTPSPTRQRRKSLFGSAGTLATALETQEATLSSSGSSHTHEPTPGGRQSPLLRKAEALLGVRLKESSSMTGRSQMVLLPLPVLQHTTTHHFPIDRPGFPQMVIADYAVEPNEYNHVRFAALRFQSGDFSISGFNLRQDLRQPPRKIKIVFSIYVPSRETKGLLITMESLKKSLDILYGDRGLEDFAWRSVCVVVAGEEGMCEDVAEKELSIRLGSVVEEGSEPVVAKLHETTAFLPFGKYTHPTQLVFLSRSHDPSSPPAQGHQESNRAATETMHWIEAFEEHLNPALGVRLYAGIKVRPERVNALWEDNLKTTQRKLDNNNSSGSGRESRRSERKDSVMGMENRIGNGEVNVVTYKERRRSSLGLGNVLKMHS